VHLSQGCATHPPRQPVAEEDHLGACCSSYHTDSHVSRWRWVPKGLNPRLTQRPGLHPAVGPGCVRERTAMSRCDRFRGSTPDPRQHQPRPAKGRRATPRGTPFRSRYLFRVWRSGATDVQRPSGQPDVHMPSLTYIIESKMTPFQEEEDVVDIPRVTQDRASDTQAFALQGRITRSHA
jgi:hypothetical protein